ncbi:MAG: hypothetical protein CNCCGFBP_00510 [Fimbriimonadaceae bacterium]|nr:hypothetical protein [Fimbriimonadaceae bacterium]QOJ12298.1 MAG: type II secretion system protein [Chthonomonadaceae bacterium]
MNQARRRCPVGAFTLIETTVTIAAVCALTSIVLPVLAKARARAIESSSASNLRQLGGAIHLYAIDNDGAPPPYTNAESLLYFYENPVGLLGDLPTNSEMPRMLRDSLEPYVRSQDVWFSPADPVKGQDRYYLGIRHRYLSYAYGGVYEGGTAVWRYVTENLTPPPSLPLDVLPQKQPIMCEPASGGDEAFNEPSLTWSGNSTRGYHSSGMGYYLFPDLHVKAYPVGRKFRVGDPPESYW